MTIAAPSGVRGMSIAVQEAPLSAEWKTPTGLPDWMMST